MTESELIATLALDTGLPQTRVRELLQSASEHIGAVFRHGNEVVLPGLGKLKPVVREERQGRNPRTGVAMVFPARHGVKFLPGKKLRERLNPPA